jgi:hypothetical protein
LAISAGAKVAAEKNVDFPTLGLPTIPMEYGWVFLPTTDIISPGNKFVEVE